MLIMNVGHLVKYSGILNHNDTELLLNKNKQTKKNSLRKK